MAYDIDKTAAGKIAFIGGDMRMIYAAERFARDGYECALYAAPQIGASKTLTRAADLVSALTDALFAIAPIPLSRDGLTVNSPISSNKAFLSDLVDAMESGIRLYAGAINGQIREMLSEKDVLYVDYGEFEDFALLNARCSAEAAIAIGIQKHEKMLLDSSIGIFGYGRIGRQLTSLLIGMGVRPTVFARGEIARAVAYSVGARVVDFDHRADKFDILFNTVPSDLSEVAYTSLAQRGIMIDLASVYNESSNSIIASGLPGRYCPESAGEIIYRCIRDHENKIQKG